MHFIPFMRGATAYEGQIGRVCYRVPYWRFMRVGCWPSLYLAPKEPEELPPGTYDAVITDVRVDERTGRVDIIADVSSHYKSMDAKRLHYYVGYGGEKPRLYRTYYPKSRRRIWRVSPMPKPYTECVRALWAHAHEMARQMNEGATNGL